MAFSMVSPNKEQKDHMTNIRGRLLRRWSPPMPAEWRTEFDSKTLRINIGRLRVFVLAMFGLGLYYVTAYILSEQTSGVDDVYFHLDLTLTGISVTALIWSSWMLKSGHRKRWERAGFFLGIYLTAATIWAGLVAGVEQQVIGNLIGLVIGAFFLATAFYLRSLSFLGLLLLGLASYWAFSAFWGYKPWTNLDKDITPVFLIILAWLASRLLYRAWIINFTTQKNLLQAQQALEDRVAERSRHLLETNQRLQEEIEQRKKVEEALRESEKQFRMLVEKAPMGIIYVDTAGNIIDVNPHFLELLGSPDREATLAINVLTFPLLVQAGFSDKFRQCLESGKAGVHETAYTSKWGRSTFMRYHLQPLYDGDGRSIGALGLVEDISVEKAQEQQLRQAQKMEAIGTLAGGVAHDFNNLLQAISGFTQILLMDKKNNDPDHQNLKAIENAGQRAAGLVRQLLLFSRKTETERKPVDLNQEVEHVRKLLERTIPKMVDIDLHLGRDLWTIKADPIQVEQVLLNLGVNAADAMPEGGILTIKTENTVIDEEFTRNHSEARPGRCILLTVSDNGHGMDDETVKHIFEPFYTTKEIGKGTGLGLASVYGIIKGHGGSIICNSNIGRGTTFKIFLPAVDDFDAGEKMNDISTPPGIGTETILLVDDEEPIRDFAAQALKKFGYTVLTASSGEEALEIYTGGSHPIDLIVMDIGMPGMGGYKCLQKIVRFDSSSKILIASGYAIDEKVKKTLAAGAAGFIGKPYRVSDLLEKARSVLEEGK